MCDLLCVVSIFSFKFEVRRLTGGHAIDSSFTDRSERMKQTTKVSFEIRKLTFLVALRSPPRLSGSGVRGQGVFIMDDSRICNLFISVVRGQSVITHTHNDYVPGSGWVAMTSGTIVVRIPRLSTLRP